MIDFAPFAAATIATASAACGATAVVFPAAALAFVTTAPA